ncbi:MAG: glycine zipper 2TM domain-containing protein [Rhodoferax sp.]
MKHAPIIKKALFVAPVVALTAGVALAQELGQVISATPVMQQVGVPRQVCTTEQVAMQAPRSGAGALIGAIAGGAIGNAVGSGSGRAAATLLGVIGGSVVGDRVEGQGSTHIENVQRCEIRTLYENRVVAYNVVYEYAGKRYAAQVAQDPGATLQLQLTPVGASAQMTEQPQAPINAQPVYLLPSAAVVGAPAYPSYYTQPYYPPIAIQFGVGYWGSGRYRH